MASAADRGLTDQQHRAVTSRDVSVALSAGAGCGKTFVLTKRFLAHLEPGETDGSGGRPKRRSQLGGLVAITFTDRAAREMRGRIRGACRRRLQDAPDAEADHWLELIRDLDSARISTIHSFCGTLLRSHAVEARLDPHFRVLEQTQAQTLLFELIDDTLRGRLAEQEEAVLDLVVEFGIARLRSMVSSLLGARQEIDWDDWQDETPDDLVARWETFWREESVPAVLKQISDSLHARTLLEVIRNHPPDHPTMRDRCAVLAEHLPKLAECDDPSGVMELLRENAKVQGGGGKKAWPSETVYKQFRDAAAGLRKEIDRTRPFLAFDRLSARPAAEVGLRLLQVTREVADAYEDRKRDLAALDFDDLLIHARRLLTDPDREDLRRQLASQIDLLLVDEFQDTDPLQVELVRALCGDRLTRGKLFFVGDYKQSIYRFRGADPQVFRQLRQAMPDDGRLPLTLNFRSQPAILDFVNGLFCEALGEEYEPLAAHRPQVSPEPAVEFLWAVDDMPDERSGQTERIRRREADFIARRIRSMIDSGEKIVWDEEAAERGTPDARAVRPGDVALLFRALSNVHYYEEALRRQGIDYYLVGGHAFYAQQEIFDLLNLLRSLASPSDEVSLTGVLRSPMFGLEDETLFWLVQLHGDLALGLADQRAPVEVSASQRRRVAFARSVLNDLRAIKDRLPIAQLIHRALARTGYDATLLAEFLGERKLANLNKLVDQARSFDRAGIFTLSDFITQLGEFVARQPKEPLAATHPEATDVVRLMTIHQSKGLEFPVVVVPDMNRRMQSAAASVAFTRDLGPMPRTASGPSGIELYEQRERLEDRQELDRLLYVATTRAADYLILAGGVPRLGATQGPWTELLDGRFDLITGEPSVDLPEGYREPKVEVTTEPPPLAERPSGETRRANLTKLIEETVQSAKRQEGTLPAHLAPVPIDRAARRQFSFSRMTGALHPHQPTDMTPASDEEAPVDRLDPLGLGTLVHAVMEEVEFDRPADVTGLVDRLIPRHLPEAKSNPAEPIEMVERFLASARAAQMGEASELHRELEFMLAWPIQAKTDAAEPDRYLQGFIDCLYRDASGGWHVLDYKTNRVDAASLARVAAPYEDQMLVYALAVEQIFGTPPVELVLHFVRTGQEHCVSWDDAARRRVLKQVNRGIAACVQ